jgi:hypothetical protein
MNVINLTRRLRPTTRRQRSISIAVEAMEKRLTLSPALPQPPPVVASLVANYPTGPLIPSGPCFPTGPCLPNGPPQSQVSSGYPTGPTK